MYPHSPEYPPTPYLDVRVVLPEGGETVWRIISLPETEEAFDTRGPLRPVYGKTEWSSKEKRGLRFCGRASGFPGFSGIRARGSFPRGNLAMAQREDGISVQGPRPRPSDYWVWDARIREPAVLGFGGCGLHDSLICGRESERMAPSPASPLLRRKWTLGRCRSHRSMTGVPETKLVHPQASHEGNDAGRFSSCLHPTASGARNDSPSRVLRLRWFPR